VFHLVSNVILYHAVHFQGATCVIEDVIQFLFAVIENLPMEMRDRFTEMREMDLEVQSEAICNIFLCSQTIFIEKMQ